MNQCVVQQQAITADIGRINTEISLLEKALSKIEYYRECIYDNKRIVNRLPYQFDKWHGTNANIVFQSCYDGALSAGYAKMLSDIVKANDAIDEKVNELRGLLADKESALSKFFEIYSSLAYEWDAVRNGNG